jgi:hypothetical protein
MIWCVCGDGRIPGFTSGSARSTVSWEHAKRSMFCAEIHCVNSALAAMVVQNMMAVML